MSHLSRHIIINMTRGIQAQGAIQKPTQFIIYLDQKAQHVQQAHQTRQSVYQDVRLDVKTQNAYQTLHKTINANMNKPARLRHTHATEQQLAQANKVMPIIMGLVRIHLIQLEFIYTGCSDCDADTHAAFNDLYSAWGEH